jgi:hypothetical protein
MDVEAPPFYPATSIVSIDEYTLNALDMAETVAPRDIKDILSSASWAIHSTYLTVLK